MFRIIFICILLCLTVSAMGAKRIFVGGLSISDMKKITSIAQNNSQLKSLTIHYFRRSIITSLSFKTSLAEERFILAAERKTPRILVERNGGRLTKRVRKSKPQGSRITKNHQDEMILKLYYFPISIERSLNIYALKYDRKSTISFLLQLTAPTNRIVKRQRSLFSSYKNNLKAFPDDGPIKIIHCVGFGLCMCEGYDSCNTLGASCAEVGQEWTCQDYDAQGGCISGVCY